MPLATNDAGEYLYLSPDGWAPAKRAVNPETKEVAIFDGDRWVLESTIKGAKANADAGPLDNVVRTLARGAGMGFMDELSAAANAGVGAIKDWWTGQGPGFQNRYAENLAYERGRDKALDASNPIGSAVGQVAGGVGAAGALPMVRPFQGAAALPTLGNVAANSALAGGVTGFGEGEGGIGARLQGAGIGAGVGAVAGPLLAGAADLGQKFGRAASNAFGLTDPDVAAKRLLARALSRDAIPEQELAARAAQAQDPQILADIAGRNTAGLSALTARVPSEAPEIAAATAGIRRDARPDRIASAVDTALGGGAGDDVARVAQSLGDQRRIAAAPLYEKAFERPVTIADARKVQRFVTDPIGQEALQSGMRVIELEHLAQGKIFEPAKFGVTRSQDSGKWIVDPDILDAKKAPTFRLLDAVKRGFDEIVEGFRDKTTGRLDLNQYGRAVNDVRAEYRGRLVDLNPTYGEALKAWSDPSQSLDALRRGQAAFRGNRDTTAAMAGRVADQDRPFLELGAGRAIADMTSDPSRAADAARRLVEDRQMRARMESVLPDPMRRDFLTRALEREASMARTDRIVSPNAGSQTMPLTALADDMASDPMIVKLLARSRAGGAGSALSQGALDVYRASQGLRPEAADALAPLLFGRGPEAIQEAIKAALEQRRADQIAAALIANRTQRAITGGAIGGALLAN